MNIEHTKEPIFREKQKQTELPVENVSFDSESDHPEKEWGKKAFTMTDQERQSTIGRMTYDYPEPNDRDQLIRIFSIAVAVPYQGQDLSLKLYKHLISLAKTEGLNGIRSDSIVQGGALATWKKLQEMGYNIKVHPSVMHKWVEFTKTFDEGKFYKEAVSIPDPNISVFKLYLKSKH